MWYFTCEKDKRIIYISSLRPQVTLGRSADLGVSDFSIQDDTSLSRKHAALYISGDNVAVKDLGSKYGTFVNQPFDTKIQANIEHILKPGDLVRFGASHNIWTVNQACFVTCSSTLKGENLQVLRAYINELGGLFKNDWNESCTHLTMPAITLTIKVVMALVQGAHIVTVDYWKSCCEAVKLLGNLPDPKNFLPQIIESTLNKEIVSFHPKIQRHRVFAGKTVIFISKRQLEMYKTVIEMGSGTPALLSESKMTKSMLSAPDVVVIQYTINNTTQESQAIQNQINGIVNYLKTKGKRVIADAEIGLAILYCSVDKYCNPDFNFSSEVMKSKTDSQLASKPSNILVHETQDTTKIAGLQRKITIDESLTSVDLDFPVKEEGFTSSKRKISEIDQEHVENISKKFATGQNVSEMSCESNSELFNFVQGEETALDGNNVAADTNNKNKLNFSRPMKRKQEQEFLEGDELFNFIAPKEQKMSEEGSHSKMFDNGNIKEESSIPQVKRTKHETPTNIQDFYTSMGVELKEQAVNNVGVWTSKSIKEEVTTELENAMKKINLCKTVVEFDDLIVDRIHKPIMVKIEDKEVVNVKTFVKVTPARRAETLIDDDSMIEWISGKGDVSSRTFELEDEVITFISDNRHRIKT